MKKTLLFLTFVLVLMLALPAFAESTLTGNNQLMFDAIRWNLNLPKQSTIVRADEYLYKLTKDITLRALLMQVTQSEELDMMYGMGGKIMVIDLDTGDIIDYKNFNGDARWPETGDFTSKDDALHVLYNSYWSYVEGYNEFVMGEHEFVTPVAEEDIAAINAALNEVFVRQN